MASGLAADSPIIECACGAKIRLPKQRANRAFRCPRCKQGIPLSAQAKVLATKKAGPRFAGSMCPICQSEMAAEDLAVKCPACDQVHHSECWSEIGGCGTYGCGEAPELKKEDNEPEEGRAGWGDTKRCPSCRRKIKSMALRCRFCRAEFPTADPMTPDEFHNRSRTETRASALRTVTVVLFVLSLIGVLAPLLLPLCAVIFGPQRKALQAAGPLYVVLAYATVGLSFVYSLLILMFWLAP
ncbi:RING finger protein [Thalassoroseus pseudoceratinae]|uniref:RING finger protein n=1 Tax=Thalassoroseus pseudoceratinae TaxID=2713176 RepID=UPI001421BA87|nr:RING finger protein [Thalassoroseus pseudoceratinae]